MKATARNIKKNSGMSVDRNPWKEDVNCQQQGTNQASPKSVRAFNVGGVDRVATSVVVDRRYLIQVRTLIFWFNFTRVADGGLIQRRRLA
ncbi:MAG: hypothetical protein ACK5NG_10950 [Chthoniobacterales bacterium]